ncbi:hypothetical protein EDD92_1584 [Streptomyces sp. TLI_185]|nr:hypothetical protein EDD92_1584 [Streptomyces sp. TLI_185]
MVWQYTHDEVPLLFILSLAASASVGQDRLSWTC